MDVIFCGGGNRITGDIAISEGMKYGIRNDYKPYWSIFMLDIRWTKYHWPTYLEKVAELRPTIAMVPDYECAEDCGSMMRRAFQLVELGVERVMVCPKFVGAVADIPDWCIVAISVVSPYAGFEPPGSEVRGRRLHLLGGSPTRQIIVGRYYSLFEAEVVSFDVNAHQKAAWVGTYFDGRKWRNKGPGAISSMDAFRLSCRALVNEVPKRIKGRSN